MRGGTANEVDRISERLGDGHRWVPEWIPYGLILHPCADIQVVSDTEGDEGFTTDMEIAALMLVKVLKRDGLLDRHWEEIISL